MFQFNIYQAYGKQYISLMKDKKYFILNAIIILNKTLR